MKQNNFLNQKTKRRSPIPTIESKNISNKKLFVTSPINTNFISILEARKTQSLQEYNKYKLFHTISNLKKSLYLDNTNHEVVFTYLTYLKQSDLLEFDSQFNWRKLFLTKEEVKALNENDSFSSYSPRDLLKTIINNKVEKNKQTFDWMNKVKSIINDIKLYNPYVLRYLRTEKDLYVFSLNENNNDELKPLKFKDDLSPNIPYFIDTEDNAYKYIMINFNHFSRQLKKPSSLNDVLCVIGEIMNCNLPIKEEIEKIMQIINSQEGEQLTSCLKYILNKIKSSIEISNIETEIFEIHIKDKYKYLSYKTEIHEVLSKFLKSIINTKCIRSMLQHFFAKSQDLLFFLNSNFINHLLSHLTLQGLFNSDDLGYTDQIIDNITINISEKPKRIQSYIKANLFINIIICIITILHEGFGHYAQRYLYYISNGEINNKTDREYQINFDEGYYVEQLLFGTSNMLNIEKILFLLEIKNWNLQYDEFSQKFNEINEDISIEERIRNNALIAKILNINRCDIDEFIYVFSKSGISFEINMKKTMGFTIEIERRRKTSKDEQNPRIY